jgi:methyl-accepting chemotaxis protein
MMEITCNSCGKQYRIDETKLKKQVTSLKCKVCENAITVTKPVSEPSAEPAVPSPPPEPPAAPTPPSAAPTPTPADDAAAPEPAAAPAAKAKKGLGLTFKVVAIMLVVSLVPFGVFVGLTFQDTRARILRDSEVIMEETARGLGRQVDEWLDKNLRALKAAANMPGIQSMNMRTQETILKAVQEAYPYMYLVFTTDTQGMNIARSDGKSLRDYSDRAYYQGIAEGKDITWQTLIGKTSKKPALVLAVPIRQGDRFVGRHGGGHDHRRHLQIRGGMAAGGDGVCLSRGRNRKSGCPPDSAVRDDPEEFERPPPDQPLQAEPEIRAGVLHR